MGLLIEVEITNSSPNPAPAFLHPPKLRAQHGRFVEGRFIDTTGIGAEGLSRREDCSRARMLDPGESISITRRVGDEDYVGPTMPGEAVRLWVFEADCDGEFKLSTIVLHVREEEGSDPDLTVGPPIAYPY